MKKLFMLFITVTTISFTSCSTDDNSSKSTKPEGYPEQINTVDLSGKVVGDEVLLNGKGFDENKTGEYEITFIKKVPEKKTATTTVIAPRAPKPDESNETVKAFILKVTNTSVLFTVPEEAGTGTVSFVYKKYATPFSNYQRK